MQNDIVVNGFGFRLRPVRVEDASFIVELRSDKERCRFVNPISSVVADQEAWIQRYLDRKGDYYFIIEDANRGLAEGTIGIYDVSPERKRGEVGRWVLRRDSIAAHASAVLAWQVAFEVLGLDEFYTCTAVDNKKVHTFLKYFGLEKVGVIPEKIALGGIHHNMVEYCMTRSMWFDHRDELYSKVARLTHVLDKREGLGSHVGRPIHE